MSHLGEEKKRKRKRKRKKERNKKPPADFKPTEGVLLVFLDTTGRGGLGFTFLHSYGFVRMGARYRPQYLQLPSLQPRSSMSCQAPTVHLHHATAFNPPVVPRSTWCASSLVFARPPWPEPTTRQAVTDNLHTRGANQLPSEQLNSAAGRATPVGLWASRLSKLQG